MANTAGIIAYRNLYDTATVTNTGFIDSIDNLKLRQLSKVAKCAAAGPPKITVDLGAIVTIRLVALLGIQDRLSVGTDVSDLTLEYSRDGSLYFTAGSNLALDAGVPPLPASAIVIPARAGIDGQLPSGPNIGIAARYVRVTPNWVPLSGQRIFGRLWISDALVIDGGVDGDWELDFIDPGTLDASDGSQYYEDKKTKTRVMHVTISDLTTTQAFGYADTDTTAADAMSIQGLQMEAGTTGEIILLPRTSSGLWMRRLGIYGHMDPNARATIKKGAGAHYMTSFTAIEER